ncbi:MFS transporter [Microbacterium sp. zg.Y1090]|uniref:MFS transporter n=1 Tax=Microbacterium TaxID=33882 RepID=UPI00214B681C|nr:MULTISPECIES: MFS transporter [unclassified Microbacterium]MCR2813835.1 MFS transporter [Microbacterium sp. zg.Y1084]MCR2819651.1 MFS transporter [Microbacterium sp. zg.Y1090]MDL5487499.1 MFS transporter [Microbacterium sp. zg-Y1211]WIM28104.1 MFS transporter [Microbacterium sp. zg-Y1090]
MSTLSPALPRTTDRRLLTWMFVMNAALLTCYAGFMVIFIPDQVQQIDPANKVGNLALVMTASSIGAIIIHPLIGAFSDRTRSRFGRRAPWMVISAATAAIMMVLLSGAADLWTLGVYWVLVMLALNALATAQAAIVPDRIARERFGAASGVLAMGTFLGMGLGVAGAGIFINSLGVGYATFGGMILIAALLFTVFNRDFSSRDMEVAPFRWKAFFSSFWVDPRSYPDFWWAFAGRFLLILAYQSVQSYLLYILRDYIGVSDEASTALSTPLTAVMLVGALATAFAVGKLSDRLARRKVFVIIASLIMGSALVIPLLSPTVAGMFALAAVFGLGYGIYLSVDAALMTEVLPTAQAAAKDLGILNIATTLPQALTPVVVWALISLTGSYTAVFTAGIVCAVAGALSVLPIRSVR